jgi:hypothetical protein
MNNEFKKSKINNETRYVLENSATVTTGSVATAPSSLGKVQKRGNILAQEAGKDKVPATTPRNFVAKNAKTSGAGAHKDKKKEQKQGVEKHKKPYMESLRTKIDQLKSKLAEQGVAEGKDDKIAQLKKDHDTAVHWSKNEKSPQKREAARQKAEKIKRHLDTQYKQGVAEGDRPFRGVGGAFNRGDDERHDLDPTDWYVVKDGKMFKTSVYPNQVQLAIAQGYSRTRDEAKAKADKQGAAEGFPKDPNAPKLVRDRKTGKQYDPNKEFEKKMTSPEVMAQMKRMAQKEGVEDRTSYQVAKILSDRGIKYDPAQENELINAIGMVLVKELNMSPKEARNLISYDEDFVADTLGELRSMEQSVPEVDVYMESLAHSLQQVLSEKAVSKKQQKFMGMVHAAQKGEKPASKEVAKVAKDMGKKDAKDFASTKHKGLPEKKKSKK